MGETPLSWVAWALAATALAVAYAWPLVLRVSGHWDAGTGQLEVHVWSWAGRLWAALTPAPGGAWVTVELRPLHLVPVRRGLPAAELVQAGLQAVAGAGAGRAGPRPGGSGGDAPRGGVRGDQAAGGGLDRRALWAAARAGGRWLAPQVRVDELRLRVRLGLGDAAATARTCGGAWAALAWGFAWLHRQGTLVQRARIDLVPVFAGPGMVVRGAVQARCAFGNVLAALVAAGLAYRRQAAPGRSGGHRARV